MSGLPWAVTIEPNNTCNLHCPECATGISTLQREKGQISLDEFDAVLNHLPSEVFYVNLYFMGEPLLCPNIFEFIRKLKKRNIYVSLATNGQLLTEHVSHELVASGLDRLNVSLDGIDQKSYEQYRKSGDFEKVVNGIHHITHAKTTSATVKPFLILQTLLLQSTEDQLDAIKQLSDFLRVDKVEFKTAWFDIEKVNSDLIPSEKQNRRYSQGQNGKWYINNKLKNSCFRMWTSAVITWEGKVAPCCFDKDVTYEMGNIIKKPLREIWRGSEYLAFRKHIIKNRKGIPICNNCTEGMDNIKRS